MANTEAPKKKITLKSTGVFGPAFKAVTEDVIAAYTAMDEASVLELIELYGKINAFSGKLRELLDKSFDNRAMNGIVGKDEFKTVKRIRKPREGSAKTEDDFDF